MAGELAVAERNRSLGDVLLLVFLRSHVQKHKSSLPKTLKQVFLFARVLLQGGAFPETIDFFVGQDARCTEWPSLRSSKNMFLLFAGRDEEGPARKSRRNRFVHCCVFSSSNLFLRVTQCCIGTCSRHAIGFQFIFHPAGLVGQKEFVWF